MLELCARRENGTCGTGGNGREPYENVALDSRRSLLFSGNAAHVNTMEWTYKYCTVLNRMLCEATPPALSRIKPLPAHPLLRFFNLNLLPGGVQPAAASRALALPLRVEGKNGIKRYDITTEQTGFLSFLFFATY
ncbi:uncharacterized protein V6R79_011815 [Siganus canaliculatus]